MTKIAVMGHGVVGSGVVEVFYKNRDSIQKKAGTDMDIKYILDLRDFPDSPWADRFIKSFDLIVEDPEIKVVVEVMGGLSPAYDYVKRCLENGKSVVTSNKELVAAKGFELLSIAKEHNVNFLFEASVGGGIPIIRPISQCLAANDIEEIVGILNGTTNFILTKMIKDHMSFEDALKLAQELGYAERNPAADVEGTDASRKIGILASLAFGKHVYPDSIYTEGITKISLTDVKYAELLGGAIKLVGCAKRSSDTTLSVTVYPVIVPGESQLASVDDVFNAVLVKGDAIGEVVFYGRGAGKLPTASAVVADVIDCVKHIARRRMIGWSDGTPDYVSNYKNDEIKMYFRIKSANPSADESKIKSTFDTVEILNLDAAGEFAFVTPKRTETEIDEKVDGMDLDIVSKIRIIDL